MKSEMLTSLKFKRLCKVLALPKPHVIGLLELLWQTGYAAASEVIGDEVDVETACEWDGEPGALAKVLLAERWLDADESGTIQIHDFWEHAPQYVERKRSRLNDKRSKVEEERSRRAAVDRARASRDRRKSTPQQEVTESQSEDSRELDTDEPVASQQLAYPTQPNPTQPYKENTPVVPKGTEPIASRFDEFWEMFPKARRDGREKCRKVWKSKNLEPIADLVIDGLKRWLASEDWTKEGGKYVKGTIPWMNAAKWEAFPPPAAQGEFEIRLPTVAEIQAELQEAQ